MARLYFMADGDEMVRRRARVPKGSVVEAWADQRGGGAFWGGEESRRLLDEAGEAPMPARLSGPDAAGPGFYGPRLCDAQSVPRQEALGAALADREVADVMHQRHPRALDLGRRALGVGRRAREVVLAREQVQRTGARVDRADTVSKVAVSAVEEQITLEHSGSALHV